MLLKCVFIYVLKGLLTQFHTECEIMCTEHSVPRPS